jgi:putative N6-adenine-specific DNA methylase
MKLFETPQPLFLTCNNRLSPWLEQEVKALSYKVEKTTPTGVALRGTLADCIRLNLNLRCASQVLLSLKAFHCDSPDELYGVLVNLPWEQLLLPTGHFSVTSNVYHPSIRNDMFANVRVKDAIVDRLRRKTGSRPRTGSELSGAVIALYWKNTEAQIFFDTSGETLAKHGYRKLPGKAPMLEALSAAAIYASGWDGASPFVNPMCGSGTLAIEAALIATRRSPGLLRSNYSFMHTRGYDSAVYEQEKKRIEAQVIEPANLQIIATDLNREAVRVAAINASVAGVDKYLDFSVCDFADTPVPEGKNGVVMFNPEYGERLGEVAELEKTYARMGDFLKQKCQGYKGGIFTGNLDLAKKIGLRASRRIEFFNGKIDCRLLLYEMYEGTKRVFEKGATLV